MLCEDMQRLCAEDKKLWDISSAQVLDDHGIRTAKRKAEDELGASLLIPYKVSDVQDSTNNKNGQKNSRDWDIWVDRSRRAQSGSHWGIGSSGRANFRLQID